MAHEMPALPLDLDKSSARMLVQIKAGELVGIMRQWGHEVYNLAYARGRADAAAEAQASEQQAIETEYNEYSEWCVAQGRKPMKLHTFKSFGFTADDLKVTHES